ILAEFVEEAPAALRKQLVHARDQLQVDVLQALVDLRADAGDEVLALVKRSQGRCPDIAVESLTWSKHPGAASWLREHAARHVPMQSRSQWRPRLHRQSDLPSEAHYPAILRAL